MSSRSATAPSLSSAGSTAPAGSIAPAGPSPVELSAQGLHELAVQAFRTGNRGRLSLCEALRVLDETRLFIDLGFPGLVAYADAYFQLRRSETFEHVRVAKALMRLTLLREAFGQGSIGWSVLKAVSRVASVESQESWIEFAQQNGVERTLAEARDALRSRRDTPRDSSYGLPNLDQKLVLRFSRSDMEKVRCWLESHCAVVAEGSGSDDVSLEQAILFLCERGAVLEHEHEHRHGVAYRAQIAYQQCPDCRKARVATRDGFVEVSAAEVERFEGSAEQVVIDGPTPPGLRRRVMAREGGRCGNPRCRNRADHCHHIVFRSQGGKTELANEVAVCVTCHALGADLLRGFAEAWGFVGACSRDSTELAAGRPASGAASRERVCGCRRAPWVARRAVCRCRRSRCSRRRPESGRSDARVDTAWRADRPFPAVDRRRHCHLASGRGFGSRDSARGDPLDLSAAAARSPRALEFPVLGGSSTSIVAGEGPWPTSCIRIRSRSRKMKRSTVC